MIGQIENNMNKNKSLTHEFNVLNNLLNPMKRAKSKKVISRQYYRAILAPTAEGGNLEIFESYWTAEAVKQL